MLQDRKRTKCYDLALSPIPTRKVSEDLSRDAFGFKGFTTLKVCLNKFTRSLYPLP